PESHRYPDGQNRLGTAAAGTGRVVGRDAEHIDRPGNLRRRGRRPYGRRRGQREAPVELPDESGLEGIADDLHVRQQAVHRGGLGRKHHRIRSTVAGKNLTPRRGGTETRRQRCRSWNGEGNLTPRRELPAFFLRVFAPLREKYDARCPAESPVGRKQYI